MNTTTCPPDRGGISPAAQRTIRRALTLLERQFREPGEAFTSSHAVRDWLRLQLTTLEREVFMALFLDNSIVLLLMKRSSPAPSTIHRYIPVK